jgi:hypothetical protein
MKGMPLCLSVHIPILPHSADQLLLRPVLHRPIGISSLLLHNLDQKEKQSKMPFPQHHLGRQLRLTAKRSPLPGPQTRASAPKVSTGTTRMGMTTLPPSTAHQFNHMLNKVPTNYREKASRTTFRQEQAGLLAGFWACSLVGFGCMYTTALLLEENDDGEGLAASLFVPKLVERPDTHTSLGWAALKEYVDGREEMGASMYRPWV